MPVSIAVQQLVDLRKWHDSLVQPFDLNPVIQEIGIVISFSDAGPPKLVNDITPRERIILCQAFFLKTRFLVKISTSDGDPKCAKIKNIIVRLYELGQQRKFVRNIRARPNCLAILWHTIPRRNDKRNFRSNAVAYPTGESLPEELQPVCH